VNVCAPRGPPLSQPRQGSWTRATVPVPVPSVVLLARLNPFSPLLTPLSSLLQLSFLSPALPLRVAMSNPFTDNPPPLPPKQSASSRRQHHQTHQQTRSNTRNDPSHAHHPSRSNDTPSRTRPYRSQTTGPYVICQPLVPFLSPLIDVLLPLFLK
jgi:hypothetical protein